MLRAIRIAAVVAVGSFVLVPAVFAQTTGSTKAAGQADFDACNKQAESRAASPSAAARPVTGPMVTGPKTPETGAQGGPGNAAAAGNSAGGSKDVRITGSDVPGAREAGLTGMAAAGRSDAAYQQAYRDCMKGRGF